MDNNELKIQNQTKEFEAVSRLCKAYNNLPPIVDDDYPEMRHYYEREVENFMRVIFTNRPNQVARIADQMTDEMLEKMREMLE